MSSHHHPATRVNRVFLDYENVVEVDPGVVRRKDIFLTLFRGAHQKSMKNDDVDALLASSNQPKIVDVVVSGKNALDMVLAGYVGYTVRENPGDYFHIISKDTGYDALVKQLRKEYIRAFRRERFEDIPSPVKKASSKPVTSNIVEVPVDHLAIVLRYLGKGRADRPRKRETLLNYLKSKLGVSATKQDAKRVMDELCATNRISIGSDNLVTYRI
ncbi:MAG: PIN domain-containing protein [Verrucomicrobiales bacterium]|nr:PIN domain-containing protein [Verrucomicrobiales bacterium]